MLVSAVRRDFSRGLRQSRLLCLPMEKDPEKQEKPASGSPHVLITRTPDGRLTFLQAIGSRRKGSVAAAVPPGFTGYLITDGYTGYQHLLPRLAGIQQCAQHVIRRCRAVAKLGPGSLQHWAADVIAVLRDARHAVEEARARASTALDQRILDDLLERYEPPPSAGRTTGCATGTPGTTPATPSPAGWSSTGSRSSCSPATSP